MRHSASISIKVKLALTIAMVLWASAFVGIRASLQSYSPGGLALYRFAVASVAMYVIYMRLPKRSKINFVDVLQLLLLGAATVATYHLALNYGEVTVPSGMASFIISQSPVITTFIAVVFLKERISKYGLLGMGISVLGMTVILL
jgi:drug/metabolite transporter (DMT)-like permease